MHRLIIWPYSPLHGLLSLAAWLSLGQVGGAQEEKPYGLAKRERWENTRLVGTPEPPPPYTVEPVYTNLDWAAPMFIAPEPGSDRLFAMLNGANGQPAGLVAFRDDPAVTEQSRLMELDGRMAYSFCFDPGYARNGHLYLFTNLRLARFGGGKANRVSRVVVPPASGGTIDPNTEQVILEWESRGHDGGGLAFGRDGMLYISTGDGTSDSDRWVSGQTLDDLLGGVLRIDIRESTPDRPYAVPPDNPFIDLPGARPELFAYGLRNPWRLAVDARTGQVWVGNNGQDLWETVHLVRPGENYGWSVYEGSHPFYLNRKLGPHPLTLPTAEHPHSEARSLTGGVVYHGAKWPALRGQYLYGDYSTGKIWGIRHDGQAVVSHRELADTPLAIAGFAETHSGEVLVVDHSSGIYRLKPRPRPRPRQSFATRLSDAGLFTDTAAHRLHPGVIGYSVVASAWNDGATAERAMAVPGGQQVGFNRTGAWAFPEGTALVQTLTVQREHPSGQARPFRVETRILLYQEKEWSGYSYRWNEAQTDAELVPREGGRATFRVADSPSPGGFRRQDWVFPSRADCMVCHGRAAGYILGITGVNLNREHAYGPVSDNQFRTLGHSGFFRNAPSLPSRHGDRLVDPYDPAHDTEQRVRAYLHINCAPCHVHSGGGNSRMELKLGTARDAMNLIDARPQHDTFGIANAMLVAPGAPDRSVLLQRLGQRGRGQMPPLVSGAVDRAAVALFREWIGGLKPSAVFVKNWTMADLEPALAGLETGRSIAAGRRAFERTGCAECHRFNGRGGSVGPDLSGLAKRMKPREVLESILEPSRAIADSYVLEQFTLSDGTTHLGQAQEETDGMVRLRSLSATSAPVSLAKALIVSRKKLNVSNMPPGTVNTLTEPQILDLIAYLLE
ncbi:MAG: heme-binding domain-containing protein [Verrucomicrobiales bacterium]|nr:heme-binding domain-containing protein [Verrucomicrobiales bacterium]